MPASCRARGLPPASIDPRMRSRPASVNARCPSLPLGRRRSRDQDPGWPARLPASSIGRCEGHPRGDPGRRHRSGELGRARRCRSTTAGVTVHKDEAEMFEGRPSRDKDPRESLHLDDVATPEVGSGRGAGRGDGQRDQLQHRVVGHLRAGVDLRLPGALRPAVAAVQAARPALPRAGLRPVRRRAAHRPGRERLEARRPGGGPLPQRRAGEPGRAQRHDARPGAADLGVRDQLRRAGRARAGQVQPADAEAGPPHLGGGREPRTGQLHGVPAARLAQRCRDEAGRHRADLGGQRRAGLLRHAVRPGRRRDPGLRGVQRRQGRHRAAAWVPS